MFIAPDLAQVEASAEIGAPCIELHTGAYAELTGTQREEELQRLIAAAHRAHALGLQVNAGHGLSIENIDPGRVVRTSFVYPDNRHDDLLQRGTAVNKPFTGALQGESAQREGDGR
jgi:hypothetical protein